MLKLKKSWGNSDYLSKICFFFVAIRLLSYGVMVAQEVLVLFD